MRYKFKYTYLLLPLFFLLATINAHAQYPGGVSSGTTRGYKVDYYNGTFTDQTGFGAGTSNATPGNTGYSNKITGTEFIQLDGDNFAMEYSGILEIPIAGNYTFSLYGDDRAWLYIDGVLIVQSVNSLQSAAVSLTSGDHTIKVKFYELSGAQLASLQVSNGPAGSNITSATNVDGRFVRYDGAKLTAWYKGSDLSVTANYDGAGKDKVNSWTNKAPDYLGNGNLNYTGTGWALSSNSTLVNFNPGVLFDGDDIFNSGGTQKGLSYRGATKTLFMVNQYASNVGQTNTWMFFHGDNTTSQRIGFWKNGNSTQLAVSGGGDAYTSTYTANEPKLLNGYLSQVLGGTASATLSDLYMGVNGSYNGSPTSIASNVDAESTGLYVANMNTANFPEAIYYPFELSLIQRQKVNSYLGIKYGITLTHNYLNTSGATIFSLATNTGYTNRIFGIGRELTAEGLNQKQSQSQMTSTTGYDFLKVSKGTLATTNALNTGTLADGDYLLLGDNNGALASQTTEIPASFSNGFTVGRIGREWKAQVTGNPNAVTIIAGSSTAGSYLFPGNAAGITLLVDTDGDGDFTTGTVSTFLASSVTSNVATFNNVTIPNGAVITFAWKVIAPGGVSAGLTLWAKADDPALALGNVSQWNDFSPNNNHLTRTANANIVKLDNIFNYNPTVYFSGADNQYLSSTVALGMNGDNTYGEFYVLKGLGVSGLQWDEFITLGSVDTVPGHRWENPTTNLTTASYGVYGQGTASSSSNIIQMRQLGLYSNTANGTQAILRVNGTVGATSNTTAGLSLNGSSFRIGTDVMSADGNGNWNTFQSPELIVYNSLLTSTEIDKINTYLSVKYSIPLNNGGSNYLASDGTVIWNTGTAGVFKNDIFGIGRDDSSGLAQKQSKAWVESATNNLIIALGSLATTNQTNANNFSTDKQFLMIAHNGGALTPVYTGIPASFSSCNSARYGRIWKATNTGNVTGVQFTFGNASLPISSNWTNLQLAIDSDGDGDFTTGTITYVLPSSIIGGKAIFNNITMPDGATFTLMYTVGYPGGVNKPSSGITITAPVSGTTTNNINGLTYNLYTTNGTSPRNLVTTPFGSAGDALVSSGYYVNATTFNNFVTQKVTNNFGIELTGKLYVPATLATYRFLAVAPDDQFALIIDGTTHINVTSYPGGSNVASATISLTAGYHDIIIRAAQGAGTSNFNLQWSNNSGGSYTAIPDASFYTIPSGPSAWYEADDNALATTYTDGTTLSTGSIWNDLSGNNNHLDKESAGTGVYYSTNSYYMRNYNPTLSAADTRWSNTATYLTGFPYGSLGRTAMGVAGIYATGGNEVFTGYGRDNNAYNGFAVGKSGGDILAAWGAVNNGGTAGSFAGYNLGATAYYTGTTPVTHILQYEYVNGNGVSGYGDMALKGSGAQANWPVWMNDNRNLSVGNAPDAVVGNGWNGNLNEVLYYPWTLSATERQKVSSYLAIKWGITIDQTVATNYLDSAGNTIWNASGIYKNDITGIGRDDCGNLYQKQSTSTDGSDIASFGLGSTGLSVNNLENDNSFSADKTFMMIAHNGAIITDKLSTNMPTGISSCYNRMAREWQVQTTGTVGAVSLEMGKLGLFTINASTYKPILLISNTPGNYTSATIIKYTKIEDGKAYFNNVDFGTGTKYFTIAYIVAAPGGVGTNMTVWFNANYDSFTDVAQSAYANNDGDKVASMNNIVFGAAFSKVQQSNATYQPIYYKASFNYNPGIRFAGNGATSLNSSVNVATTDYRTTTTMTSVLAGLNRGVNTDPGPPNVFWWTGTGGSGSTDKTAMERNQAFWNANTSLGRNPTLTSPEIYSFLNTVGTGYRLLSNLKTVGSGLANNTGNITAPFYIGLNGPAGSGVTAGANFDLGEFVIYSDDKGATNSNPMARIHSYMAIKYGFTLDNAALGGSYLASDGTAIYNDANYWNRITGIGMDDCSGLDQRQSFTQQTTGGLVYISNDPVNGLAASNKENPAEFTVDKSFLVFGDNNKALTWKATENIQNSGLQLMRLNRVWRVKETGTVGTVYLQVADNTSTATTKLPAPKNAASDPMYLVVANAASGGNFTSPIVVPMTLNGTDWTVTYDFTDGDYYTFATVESCIAPAGISDGTTAWYRADNKATGAIATFNDEMANIVTLTKNGAGTATINAGTASSNYNRFMALNNAAMSSTASLTERALTANNVGTLYGVALGKNNDALFGNIRSGFNTVLLANPTNLAIWNDGAVTASYATLAAASIPNFWAMNITGSFLEPFTNGTIGVTPGNTITLGASTTNQVSIGARYAGTSYTPTNNTFGEAFSFNRSLSIAEMQVLDSYLAIKYGQTLTHNYYSPDYNGTNAATTTLYDVSTYGNRILGVGYHIGGCLTQNQSNSVLTGGMLKISVDGAITAENSQDKTKWTMDRTYAVMGDNDGDITNWTSAGKPAVEANNTCLTRIARQWKVTTTNTVPALWVTIPDSTSSAATELPIVPANNSVYMVISDNPDFTNTSATQQEIAMTLNSTTKEWEASVNIDPNTTRYITFVIKPASCGLPCVPVNPATSRIRLK